MNAILSIATAASIRAILLALCVAAILAMARVRSAAVRHAAWTAVTAAMLFMPVLPALVPPISLPAAPTAIVGAADSPAELFTPAPGVPSVQPPPSPAVAAQGRAPEAPPAQAPAARAFPWRWAMLGLYLAGAAALLARLAIGWWGARSLIRAAAPVSAPSGGIPVRESAAVAAPLTAGVFRSRILLPSVWRDWPAEKLRAVLAHETAHVRRRDAIPALLAQVNRCLFWFHPLAWWLERAITASAEQAADEAVIQATGARRAYAEVLIEMAGEVRRRGGLRAAQALSMDGGALERRIDSILSPQSFVRLSRSRKAVVAVGCAAAIFLAAACREKSKSDAARVAQAESRDRQLAELNARAKTAREFETAAKDMTSEQAAALESGLKTNPDDLDARKKLLAYYGGKLAGTVNREPQKPPVIDYAAAKAALAAGLPHYFWLIEHHPEDGMASSASIGFRGVIGVFPSMLDPRPDPQNIERARKIWLEQADRDGRPAAVYLHAYDFFKNIDKPIAEKMLLRVQSADPKGELLPYPGSDSWPARLGNFYAGLLTTQKAADPTGGKDPVRAFTAQAYGPLDPGSPYAAELRKKLESSNDPKLLLSAASRLVGMGRPPQADLELGEALIKRALTLQPDSIWARQLLRTVADQRTTAILPTAVWQGDLESRHKAIEQLPTGDRFRELANLAISAGDEGVRSRLQKHDEVGEKAAWQRAGGYAKEAMDLAPQARTHPDYGTAFFNANMILGVATVVAGDAKAGASYLLKAADAPVTDALRYPIPNARPWSMMRFPATLEAAVLKAGERDAVIAFLKRYSEITISDRDRCLEDLALIRQGKPPSFGGNPL
jgi:Zn-dependent protease with chaperone function